MIRFYTSYALVFSGLCHLICCGFPLFLSINAIFSNLILIDIFTFDSELFETLEKYLFIFTTSLFLFLIFFEIYNRRIKCSDHDNCCEEQECDSTKKRVKLNILISSILYILNSMIFLSENIV